MRQLPTHTLARLHARDLHNADKCSYGKYDSFNPEHPYRQELYKRWLRARVCVSTARCTPRYNNEPCHPDSLFTQVERLKILV